MASTLMDSGRWPGMTMLGNRWIVVFDGLPAETAGRLSSRVRRAGGEVQTAVQAYTDWLVCAAAARGSRAHREALALGAPVVSVAEFLSILSAVETAEAA